MSENDMMDKDEADDVTDTIGAKKDILSIGWFQINLTVTKFQPSPDRWRPHIGLPMNLPDDPGIWDIQFFAPEYLMWFLRRIIFMFQLFITKNADYAATAGNWCAGFHSGGTRGIFSRMMDKMNRIKNHLRSDTLHNESFSDSCGDLATYGLMLEQAEVEGVPRIGTDWENITDGDTKD